MTWTILRAALRRLDTLAAVRYDCQPSASAFTRCDEQELPMIARVTDVSCYMRVSGHSRVMKRYAEASDAAVSH